MLTRCPCRRLAADNRVGRMALMACSALKSGVARSRLDVGRAAAEIAHASSRGGADVISAEKSGGGKPEPAKRGESKGLIF